MSCYRSLYKGVGFHRNGLPLFAESLNSHPSKWRKANVVSQTRQKTSASHIMPGSIGPPSSDGRITLDASTNLPVPVTAGPPSWDGTEYPQQS